MTLSGRAVRDVTGQRRVLIPTALPNHAWPARHSPAVVFEMGGETMGTTWSAKMVLSDHSRIEPLRTGIERVLSRITSQMSQWEAASDLSRFNASPAGTWHGLPQEFFKVLSCALDWAERTGGAYDPTLGTTVDLWGFGPFAVAAGPPSRHEIDEARAASGWRRLRLDRENGRAFQPGSLRLDLCGIAKGYAVDEVIAFLRRHDVADALVEIGGELRGEGVKPDGSPWWVAFERPRSHDSVDGDRAETLLALCGLSVATSGDERRFFEHAGKRYAHTIDPRTGFPLAHDLISVTVVAEDCMTADALATALIVLGPEHGPRFAAENGYAARFVRLTGNRIEEQFSPALAAMLD
jgi:FAD:protein FMN transferase